MLYNLVFLFLGTSFSDLLMHVKVNTYRLLFLNITFLLAFKDITLYCFYSFVTIHS